MSLLDDVRIRPDETGVLAARSAAAARGPVTPLVTADQVRAERAARRAVPPAPSPLARTGTVPAPGGDVGVRVIAPDGPAVAVRVVAHASGWCLGDAVQDDLLGDALARGHGIATVSVDYRLAPEHPLPAGADDVLAAVRWAFAGSDARFGTDRVVVGGASAGAHLACTALLRLRDECPAAFARVAAAELRYGCFDLGGTPSLRAAGPDAPIVTHAGTRALLGHALPGLDAERRRDPRLSPLYADLRGLPPTLVSVGDGDALLDDSVFLAARLDLAGVDTDLDVWRGCPHVFDLLDSRLCAEHAARLGPWIARLAATR